MSSYICKQFPTQIRGMPQSIVIYSKIDLKIPNKFQWLLAFEAPDKYVLSVQTNVCHSELTLILRRWHEMTSDWTVMCFV